MGKRQRRRKRERANKHQSQQRATAPQPIIWEFPEDAPRIRVLIEHDAPEDAQRISVLYWEVKGDGTWARTVSSIGVTSNVGAVAAAHAHAVLLNCPCMNCSEPISVINRSWANKVGGKYLDAEAPSYLCGDCTAIQRREETERQQRLSEQKRVEQERAQEESERTKRLIADVIKDEDAKNEPTGPLKVENPLSLALYVALINYATSNPGKTIPSLTSVGPMGWTGAGEQDRELLLALYCTGLLAIAPDSPTQAFVLRMTTASPSFPQTSRGASSVVWLPRRNVPRKSGTPSRRSRDPRGPQRVMPSQL
ncbi:hypothetical protein [Streptomyces anulatus]|uniref:hypothetical protein n=1 Tax=Streptomyces anulatus TaxID=1892 RepID=UPI001C27C62B|nr:hypothetical protein [Streptomyces anulatus]